MTARDKKKHPFKGERILGFLLKIYSHYFSSSPFFRGYNALALFPDMKMVFGNAMLFAEWRCDIPTNCPGNHWIPYH